MCCAWVSPTLEAQPAETGSSVAAEAPREDEDPLRLIRDSIRAHGGNVYEDLKNLAVSFAGRWGRIGPRLQPILADREFRIASEERYLLDRGATFQWHQGPEGEKLVYRDRSSIAIHYNGRQTRDPNRIEASAATVDLYGLLLIGPSWLTQREIETRFIEPGKLGKRDHYRVEVTLHPGLGNAKSDVVVLWIDMDTRILHRVEATLSNYSPLRGRTIDVTLGGHQWIEGKLWPTEFLQRVDARVKVVYHRWQMTGLDTDRDIDAENLATMRRGDASLASLRPARPIPIGSAVTDSVP